MRKSSIWSTMTVLFFGTILGALGTQLDGCLEIPVVAQTAAVAPLSTGVTTVAVTEVDPSPKLIEGMSLVESQVGEPTDVTLYELGSDTQLAVMRYTFTNGKVSLMALVIAHGNGTINIQLFYQGKWITQSFQRAINGDPTIIFNPYGC